MMLWMSYSTVSVPLLGLISVNLKKDDKGLNTALVSVPLSGLISVNIYILYDLEIPLFSQVPVPLSGLISVNSVPVVDCGSASLIVSVPLSGLISVNIHI